LSPDQGDRVISARLLVDDHLTFIGGYGKREPGTSGTNRFQQDDKTVALVPDILFAATNVSITW
jgi:hypothetical protein